MTDEELIIYLRRSAVSYSHPLWKAADRLEALVKELSVSNEIGRAFEEDAGQQRARAERLAAALVQCRGLYQVTHIHAAIDAALKRADHDCDDLLPCPFCGGEARTYRYNGTTQATCAGNYTDCAGTDVSAPVAMWNRRALRRPERSRP